MEYVRSYLKFDNKLVVKSKGSACGLCILWKNGMSIKEVEFDKNLIAVKIADSALDWLLVCFYGPPYHSKRKKAWGNLFALFEAPPMALGLVSETSISSSMMRSNQEAKKEAPQPQTSSKNYYSNLMP